MTLRIAATFALCLAGLTLSPATVAHPISIAFSGTIFGASNPGWDGMPINGVVSFDQESFTPQNANNAAGQSAASGADFEWRRQQTGSAFGLALLPHMFTIAVNTPWGPWVNDIADPEYLYEFQDIYNDSSGNGFSDRWLPFWYQSFSGALPSGGYRHYTDAILYADGGTSGLPWSLIDSLDFSTPIDLSRANAPFGGVGESFDDGQSVVRRSVTFRLTSVSQIPLPGSLALACLGLLVLAAVMQRSSSSESDC